MNRHFRKTAFVVYATAALACASAAFAGGMTTFDSGDDGWNGPTGIGGTTFIDNTFGNPAPALRTQFNNFGITFRNNTNPDYIGDYTATSLVDISIDTYTTQLDFGGTSSTPREFIVELRDYDNPPQPFPWVSVWASLGVLNQDDPGWHTWSVSIADTSASDPPAGWGGFGAEDPNTFEPTLPADRTFASVLAGVDELAFTTLVPGFDFIFSDYDVAIDNINVAQVPEPSTATLLALCGLTALIRRR